MKSIKIVGHHSDCSMGDGKMMQRVETSGIGGILCEGTPLVTAYELQIWKEAAKQAALLMSSMIGSHQSQMTQETIHEALALKHAILKGAPEEVEYVATSARAAFDKLYPEDEDDAS